MKFPNAEKGIKKLIISVIFSIIAAVLINVPMISVNIMAMMGGDPSAVSDTPLWFFVINSSFAALTAQAFALVLSIIGYIQASNDEKDFKKAMVCSLAGGAMFVFISFFQILNTTLSTILSAASMILEMFVMIYSVTALIHLSEQCDREDMVKKGNTLLKFLVCTYIIAALNALIIRTFELSSKSIIVAVVIGVIDLVLNIAQFILYLSYLKKTAKMLAGAEWSGT